MRFKTTPKVAEPEFGSSASSGGDGRTKLLIEDPDAWAYAEHFEGAGFDVALCAGPQAEGDQCSRCPLVESGQCAAVDEADVILSSLPGEVGKPIVHALAERSRRIPTVLHVPAPQAAEYHELFEDATLVPVPASLDELETAIRKAVA